MPAVELDRVGEHVIAVRLNRPDRLNAIGFRLVADRLIGAARAGQQERQMRSYAAQKKKE